MDQAGLTTGGSKPLEYLVLDAGALIRGHGLTLYHKAKRVVTVPDVLMEIRDSKSRELLEKLPFEIEERMPSQSSINAVAAFAKKTGDFAAISKTDLRLIALTHMLELELNGKKYLNDVAGKVPMTPLSAQIERTKAKQEPQSEGKVQTPVLAGKNPLPKPNIWASKSWATVLAGDSSSTTPVFEGTLGNAAEEDSEKLDGGAEEADSEEGEEESASDEEVEEEEESEGEEEEDQQEAGEEESATEVCVDHFTAAAAVQDLENALLESGAFDPVEEVVEEEEEHIVSGFHDEVDCGCGTNDGTHEGHIHIHNDPSSAAATAPAPAPAHFAVMKAPSTFTSTSASEPYHSRMMRPSGLASGNNAESQRLRLEDNGLGWVNSANLLQQKGRNGHSFPSTGGGGAKKVGKPKSSGEDSTVASLAPTEAGQQSVSASAASGADSTTAFAVSKKKKPKKRPTKVACLTTDFSMQNVMLQMDLRVMSVDGLMIKTVRQWVLRCMGCFEVHYDMDRLFCRKCGGHHLSRVSASVDAGGALKLHLKKNYHVDLQGSKYSLPAPGKQGRYQGELLLREDQLLQGIWKQKCVKIRKDIKSAFGEDVTSDVGMHINKGQAIKIGLGKQNPNAAKGRERRGKSKGHTVK